MGTREDLQALRRQDGPWITPKTVTLPASHDEIHAADLRLSGRKFLVLRACDPFR